jgi:hypothetical protein
MRPLLIGQAPSRCSDPTEPLSGATGRRLAELCGLTLQEYLFVFERRNLLPEWPGKAAGKGDRFVGLVEGRRLAEACRPVCQGRRVVVLGFSTAKMFGMVGPALSFSRHWGGEFAHCPHPSGVNHWWNEDVNLERAGRFWRRLAKEATDEAENLRRDRGGNLVRGGAGVR